MSVRNRGPVYEIMFALWAVLAILGWLWLKRHPEADFPGRDMVAYHLFDLATIPAVTGFVLATFAAASGWVQERRGQCALRWIPFRWVTILVVGQTVIFVILEPLVLGKALLASEFYTAHHWESVRVTAYLLGTTFDWLDVVAWMAGGVISLMSAWRIHLVYALAGERPDWLTWPEQRRVS